MFLDGLGGPAVAAQVTLGAAVHAEYAAAMWVGGLFAVSLGSVGPPFPQQPPERVTENGRSQPPTHHAQQPTDGPEYGRSRRRHRRQRNGRQIQLIGKVRKSPRLHWPRLLILQKTYGFLTFQLFKYLSVNNQLFHIKNLARTGTGIFSC